MLSILKQHAGLLVLWGVIAAVVAGVASFLFPICQNNHLLHLIFMTK